MNHEIRNTPEFTPDVSLLAFLSGEIQSTKHYVRIYQRNMQNKPNFKDAKMNVTIYYTKVYKNETAFRRVKNKPNCRKGKIDANCLFTKDYEKKCG